MSCGRSVFDAWCCLFFNMKACCDLQPPCVCVDLRAAHLQTGMKWFCVGYGASHRTRCKMRGTLKKVSDEAREAASANVPSSTVCETSTTSATCRDSSSGCLAVYVLITSTCMTSEHKSKESLVNVFNQRERGHLH